jgi:hypothetical protein
MPPWCGLPALKATAPGDSGMGIACQTYGDVYKRHGCPHAGDSARCTMSAERSGKELWQSMHILRCW